MVKPFAQLSPSFFLFILLYIPIRPDYSFAHYPEHNLDIEKCLVAFQTWFNDFKYMQIIHANNISCSRKIETRWVDKDWFRNNMNNCTPIFVKKQLKNTSFALLGALAHHMQHNPRPNLDGRLTF